MQTSRHCTIVKRPGGDDSINDDYSFDVESKELIVSSEFNNDDPNEIILKLRLDQQDTFLKTAPILTEEESKKNYLIECYNQQGINKGKFFRCRIKNTVAIHDDTYGQLLQVTGEAVEVRVSETPVSHPLRFKTPAYAMTQYMIDYNKVATKHQYQEKLYGFGIITKGKVVTSLDSTVLLDDTATLKQHWIPGGIKNYYDVFDDVIQKLSLSQAQKGTNKEFFLDYEYPNNEFSGAYRLWIKVIAKEFGADDSGITIDPISPENPEEDSTEIIDNTKYFDRVILECDSQSASIPMARTRFFSDWEHAKLRDEYDYSTTYQKDDQIKCTDRILKTVRYYKSKQNNNTHALPVGISPDSNDWWDEDFHKSNRYSLLTNNLEIWKANLSGYLGDGICTNPTELNDSVSCQSGYIGAFVDPNFVRMNTDYGDLDHYDYISIKDIIRIAVNDSGIPINDDVYDGQRFIPGQNKNNPITIEPFASNLQRVAEYDKSENTWKFSREPQQDDVIFDHSTLNFYKYDGVFPDGSWKLFYDYATGWQTLPVHPVKSMRLTTDIHGISNAAVEFYFDWGDGTSRHSRGYWFTHYHPTPRKYISPSYPVGKIFSEPFLDTHNYSVDSAGEIGYSGLGAEDQSRIRG
ncbi:MAG: hypothetical protein HRU07_06625 [Nitrosopumilus sp.]|nr:hypothetical protein [Nitrosopumilus sp.]NRA05815.1 hypothetical protein [Nitrosopumilus sp.]